MHDTPQIIDVGNGVFAVDTHYVRPLMDASHLIVQDGRAAFVDTGTSHSVPHLLDCLLQREISPDSVDYIFLTHIHLDHAGGAGTLLRSLPNAKVVLHPRGAGHMIAPQKLIAGTKAVYGESLYASLYGNIVPVPEERVIIVEDGDELMLCDRRLEFLHTPGHALHHYCIADRAHRAIFSGDTFGVSYRETDTAAGPFIFPTTTPTQFDPDAAHASYDRIVSYEPETVYLTHYSRVGNIPKLAQDLHRRLDAFVEIAKGHVEKSNRAMAIARDLRVYIFRELKAHGVGSGVGKREAVVGADIDLNAQGLDVWLHRLRKLGQI
jgi:glyoxylase-like metal-dependent hydrolase (beta-lactamase superfamily II)